MTGKQRVLNAMKCKETDRIPWVPFVGVHGGSLLGKTASEYLKSEDLIVEGISSAIEKYQADGVPVVFDLQLEAECFGCDLSWSDDTPPAVTSHPLSEGVLLKDLQIPSATSGRIGIALGATRRLREKHPDTALFGLITGPFTLALHLLGTDIFMKMFDCPDEIDEIMTFCGETCKAMSNYYIEAGCDVVAVVDPMTSQIGPDQFRQFVTPHALDVFAHIHQAGSLSSFFVCGHAEQNLRVMCDCRPDNICVDENIPLATIRDICLESGVSFGGNLQLTVVLLLGKPIDAQHNAVECMEVAGPNGFILAPGCDLPYATPVENLQAVGEVVVDAYQADVVRAQVVVESQQDLLDMSEYGQADKVIVDIITLDSEACAPCQYMVESVKQVAPEFEGIVEWREHKIKYREKLVFMASLMVRNIPTICIDGQITFVSRIPAKNELIGAIQKRIFEKMRVKIRQRKGHVFVLGSGKIADELMEKVEKAITELGGDVGLSQITDEDRILGFGVLPAQTPAIVTGKYRVRSTNLSPEQVLLREWIKDLI